MDKIRYEDFKTICRICMSNCDINFNKNSVVLDIFYKLTDAHFETNHELPEQFCLKCVDFMNEIHSFSMTYRQTHSVLMKCLNNYKNNQIKQETEIMEETNEELEVKNEETIEEHNIEFVNVEVDNDLETNDFLNKDVTESTDLLLPVDSTYIQTENEDHSLNIINSNVLNKFILIESKFKIRIEKELKRKHIIEHPTVSEINNKVQRRRYKCDECEKAFIDSRGLNVHKRVHSGERPYQCDQCKKSFSVLSNLNVHKRLHTGERLYKCDQCEKSFNTSSDLKTHKRRHTGERAYKCDQCEKSFNTSTDLKTHKRVHTGERPYKCDVCEKSFTRLGHLKEHKLVRSHDVK